MSGVEWLDRADAYMDRTGYHPDKDVAGPAVAALRAVLDTCLSIEADAKAGQQYAAAINRGGAFMAEQAREATAREIRQSLERRLGNAL